MRVASHTPIDEALVERMRDRIVEACDPKYLYLFGSVARGEETPESDVDLLVVTDPSAGTTVSEVATRLQPLIREDGLPIDLIVQTPDQFRRQLRLPGFIARTARRDGHLLYGTESLPPMPDLEYRDAAQEWYEHGDHERRMARLLLSASPPELGGVAFHSQQAAEKYLKAMLTLYGAEPPYAHDLGELLDRVEEYEEDFEAFRAAAEALSHFAVAVRYPNPENVPSDEEAQGLVSQVDAIRAEVQKHLEIEE